MRKSIFIFRRDLRLDDNHGLIAALAESDKVLPIFIFDPNLVQPGAQSYCAKRMHFLCESLHELHSELSERGSKLFVYSGEHTNVLNTLLATGEYTAVYVNRDYTPYARTRDTRLKEVCDTHNVSFEVHATHLLTEPEDVLKDDGEPYRVYTPFMKKARSLSDIPEPIRNTYNNYLTTSPVEDLGVIGIDSYRPDNPGSIAQNPGRAAGLAILSDFADFTNYADTRDIPSEHGTTQLSAHFKFGTVSIREAYHAAEQKMGRSAHKYTNELYWRDFYAHIAYHFPHVLQGRNFNDDFDRVTWENNIKWFDAWCTGTTGFPIVDAGMRELNATGWMHNRVRMIVASFLTKDLHIDWRWGEQYFRQQLVDYDAPNNNGGWQWVAGTGADAAPYFRIFNPWLQQKKFDPECHYIKKWIPELKDIDQAVIHNLDQHQEVPLGYPHCVPIIEHSAERKRALELYGKKQ